MKRYQSRALLAGALCLTLTAQAGALSVSGVAGLGASAAIDVTLDTLEREGINAAPPVQDAQNIGFTGLEKTVRANNLTIQSFHKRLQALQIRILIRSLICRSCNMPDRYRRMSSRRQRIRARSPRWKAHWRMIVWMTQPKRHCRRSL